MVDFYNLPVPEVFRVLNVSEEGLSSSNAKNRLEQQGKNVLPRERRITVIGIFLSQFKNAILLLLIFAGVLSVLLDEMLEASVIFGIIILDALLGFVQEYRAERAIEALEKLSAPTARVLRDGKESKIPASELVSGDIVLLEAGDIVPADARIFQSSSLQIDESSLTGESVPSKKIIQPFKLGTSVADQENMAFMHTVVTYGKGKCVVTATCASSEIGKIASTIQKTKEGLTPLQKKFRQLAEQIGMITVALILIVLASGTLQGLLSFSKMLVFALALTVSTIPNSLPVIITVSLSMGAKRLVAKNMLVKKLPAVESLGSVTIICADKTGTITKNEMTITKLFVDGKIVEVSGTGYEPRGHFFVGSKQVVPKKIELLLKIGCLCNNARLVLKNGKWSVMGDPTEGSLIVLGKKGLVDDEELRHHFVFVEELPFDSERKRMSVLYKNERAKTVEAYVKGAPEILVDFCTKILENGKVRKLTVKDKEKIISAQNLFARKALRTLALAYRDVSEIKNYSVSTVENNLVFVGIVGMIDPARNEVKSAIEKCENAGIKVMMITGDNAVTAQAIGEQIGLLKQGDVVITGEELDKMSDEQLASRIERVRIFARALPIQKTRIVDALQKKGHIVAMTGDGVNDAPALKKADIGIAMGITGSDVAKEVSKATLVDDNFATIVNAVEEGRNIYNKMLKSAGYLLSCNAGEITAVFFSILLRFPLPLKPLQLLMMSLITDDFPALGLGMERSESGMMALPPRAPDKKPISTRMLFSIILFGLIMGFGTLAVFYYYKDISLAKAQTMAFTTLVMFQMFAVLSSRTSKHSLSALNPFSNVFLLLGILFSISLQVAVIYVPQLQVIFGTTGLSLVEWIEIIVISSTGFIVMELSKLFTHRNTA